MSKVKKCCVLGAAFAAVTGVVFAARALAGKRRA